MKEIRLNRGKVALVDDEDYEWLSAHKWHAQPPRGKTRAFYALRTVNGKGGGAVHKVYMHRAIMGAAPGVNIDHIDGDGLNNTRANLRPATVSQNACNQTRKARGCSSRFKGVTWNKASRKWQASIKHRGRSHYLGLFIEEASAAQAYLDAARNLFGEFACPATEAE